MSLSDDLQRIAAAATRHAAAGEQVAGVLAAEPAGGVRRYLCAFAAGEVQSWLVLDADGEPVTSRLPVRETASIVAACEVAEETAGGGHLEELRQTLVQLRLTENPEGIDDAEAAALALERTIGAPPRVASPCFLDVVGAAARVLETALGQKGESAFAQAMKAAMPVVEAFTDDVLVGYKTQLD